MATAKSPASTFFAARVVFQKGYSASLMYLIKQIEFCCVWEALCWIALVAILFLHPEEVTELILFLYRLSHYQVLQSLPLNAIGSIPVVSCSKPTVAHMAATAVKTKRAQNRTCTVETNPTTVVQSSHPTASLRLSGDAEPNVEPRTASLTPMDLAYSWPNSWCKSCEAERYQKLMKVVGLE